MHFHVPKPLHGWRGFVGEVGIIVPGVLKRVLNADAHVRGSCVKHGPALDAALAREFNADLHS